MATGTSKHRPLPGRKKSVMRLDRLSPAV